MWVAPTPVPFCPVGRGHAPEVKRQEKQQEEGNPWVLRFGPHSSSLTLQSMLRTNSGRREEQELESKHLARAKVWREKGLIMDPAQVTRASDPSVFQGSRRGPTRTPA